MKSSTTLYHSSTTERTNSIPDTRRRLSSNNIKASTSARTMLASARRRSSASVVSEVPNSAVRTMNAEEKKSIFCPRPKKGFFYSSAYKEHKQKRKEKKKVQSDDNGSSSVDDEIPLVRDLTRRKRNSFHKRQARDRESSGSIAAMEPTNVTAYLAARVESEKPNVTAEVYNHSDALHAGSMKSHMMDISLVGEDGVEVRASRFILACYSSLLEEVFFKGRKCPRYNAASSKMNVPFCNEQVLKAAVYHSFHGELPSDFAVTSHSEKVARSLAQLDYLAYYYKFGALGEVTYRVLRKMINNRAVLACAIFDELSYREEVGCVDSIKRYALDTMREMPMDTFLAGGVQWMKEVSVEAIIQDQDMDVDEFYMFKILNAWALAYPAERLPVAQRLSEHIELKFIDPDLLMTQVKRSGYYPEKQIVEAVKLIKDSVANRDPCEMERVLVEGAGTEIVNGIYCRVEEDIGMGEEETLFVKEADDMYSDVGLYLYGTRWHIAMCADYSNCFYSCDDVPNKSTNEFVPGSNWKVQYRGQSPSPFCTYLPITRKGRLSNTAERTMIAPNLQEMIDPTIAEKRRSGYFDKRTEETVEKRTMTLEQMMNLPEDQVLKQHE